MPYRNQATVQSWVDEYVSVHSTRGVDVSVLEKNFIPGPDSGMVVVALQKAPTVTYIQPLVRHGTRNGRSRSKSGPSRSISPARKSPSSPLSSPKSRDCATSCR